MRIIDKLIQSPYNPLRFDHTKMKSNLLLMCKLLFFLLVLHGFHYYINDPYLPFISFFDYLKSESNIFKNVLRSLFYVTGFLLVFNYKTRLMAILLGLVVIFSLLASKPVFANHKFFCGCIFLLAGLSNKKGHPWLIYMQLSIMYFGAALNKVLQIDWWNGVYMENWMVNVLGNSVFMCLSALFPKFFVSKVLSISAFFIEFLLSVLVFLKKRHTMVVFLILIFHTALYTLTTLRFGHFYENMLIVLIAFLKWPKRPISIYVNNFSKKWFVEILLFFESINYLRVTSDTRATSSSWLKIRSNNEIKHNFYALSDFLLYNPLFYITLFSFDIFIRILFDGSLVYFTQISFIWIIIAFFSIIEFRTFRSKYKSHQLYNN